MKKAVMIGLAVLATAAVVNAATSVVTSVNIVGFNKVTCPRGKAVLVSTAFESLSGAPLKSADVFGTQVPVNTTIFAFDTTQVPPTYISDTRTSRSWGTNITYSGTMGFWIYVPDTADDPSYDVYLMGQVPMASATSNTVYNQANLLGYPYTASVLWTNTSLAKNAAINDTLFIYDKDTGYISFTKTSRGWGDGNSLVITPGMGFWFVTSNPMSVNVENRPYNP